MALQAHDAGADCHTQGQETLMPSAPDIRCQQCREQDESCLFGEGDSCPYRTQLHMKTGVEMIAEERARQVSKEGWTAEHDDDHGGAEIARAAACYALPSRQRQLEDAHIEMDAARGCADPAIPYTVKVRVPKLWPWDPEWWKPTPEDRVRELVKAGALIAAEIDRLNRQPGRNAE